MDPLDSPIGGTSSSPPVSHVLFELFMLKQTYFRNEMGWNHLLYDLYLVSGRHGRRQFWQTF